MRESLHRPGLSCAGLLASAIGIMNVGVLTAAEFIRRSRGSVSGWGPRGRPRAWGAAAAACRMFTSRSACGTSPGDSSAQLRDCHRCLTRIAICDASLASWCSGRARSGLPADGACPDVPGPGTARDDGLAFGAANRAVVGQVDSGRPRRSTEDFSQMDSGSGFVTDVRQACAARSAYREAVLRSVPCPTLVTACGRTAVSPSRTPRTRPHDPGRPPSRNRRLERPVLARSFAPGCLGAGRLLLDEEHRTAARSSAT